MQKNIIRVLHVVTSLNRGGIETMLMNHYRNINRDRIQFDFLVHRKEKGKYEDEVLQLGGKIYRIRKLNPFDKNYKSELYSFFLNHPYKIIHVHQDCLSSVVLKVAKKCKIPVRIAHSHSSRQDYNCKYILKIVSKHYIKKYATNLLACSIKAGKWMFETDDFDVFHNAVNVQEFVYNEKIRKHAREALGISQECFVVSQVGNFSDTKNHLFTLDFFSLILQKKQNSKLFLAGEGYMREKIERKIKRLNLDNHVVLLGSISNVAQLLQATDVFVLPSKYEGLPVVTIEAQASGLPCICSNTITKEISVTNLCSFLPIDDYKIWADEILKHDKQDRKDTTLFIKKAGYDVLENSKFMEEMYIKMLLESNRCLQ